MIPVPAGVRVWLATGHSDMRKGFPGLGIADAGEAQDRSALRSSVRLSRAPRWACQGDLARRTGRVSVLQAAGARTLYWPTPADGAVTISPAQLGYLLKGIDWRAP